MPNTLLIVDDEPDLLVGLERTVKMDMDCRVLTAGSGAQALELVRQEPVDVVLADICMPEMDGLQLLAAIREINLGITVIIMTAYGTIERAVEAIKAGAYDFIQKPLDEERLLHLLRKGFELNRLVRENRRLMEKICEKAPFENIVGHSRPMQEVLSRIQMLARTNVTVLILGETGTGKELAAQAIHGLSPRRDNPMVTVNCPALPESILESELFGYRKGAFTNATENKKGLFDEAHGSTIFLDEIGDLSLPLQTKLLRVLQDKMVQPLGATAAHKVDVRIIAATNQNLPAKIRDHKFREDLYYRLNVAALTMPPLAAMREEIPLLAEHFLEKIACEQNAPPKSLSPEAMGYLLEKEWPGNVRELENTIRGWVAFSPGPVITPEVLPETAGGQTLKIGENDITRPYKELEAEAIEAFTLDYLHRLSQRTRGNVSLSAEISGINRQSLQKIINRYKVPMEDFRT